MTGYLVVTLWEETYIGAAEVLWGSEFIEMVECYSEDGLEMTVNR